MADSVELPDSIAEPSDSDAEPSDYFLLADVDNIVDDVLVENLGRDRAGRAPEPLLFFNDLEMQKRKPLAEYGIELGSVLHLKCPPRVLGHTDHELSYTEIAKMDGAESSSPMRPNGDGEMKIFVQSEYHGNYALEVGNSNTIQDVFITVLPIRRLKARPEPKLYFNGQRLEMEKSLADYGIQDGSILHLEGTNAVFPPLSYQIERPNVIPGREKIMITDQPLAIWSMEHDKVLLNLLVEQNPNGGWRNLLSLGRDFWCNIVAKFNESTGLKYECKHLFKRFIFYRREYSIVKGIKNHPMFIWDHQQEKVIATDAEWNEYIKENPDTRPYRRRTVPYINLLEIIFADKKESQIVVSNE